MAYTDHALLTESNRLDWTAPKLYVYAVLNISVSLAFYGLMKFYYATSAQLAWCDPWSVHTWPFPHWPAHRPFAACTHARLLLNDLY